MKLVPLNSRVIVERKAEEKATASGIIIPDSATEKPDQGVVSAVASDVLDVVVGDTVLFGKYAGQSVSLEGVDYLVIKHEDLLAVVGE